MRADAEWNRLEVPRFRPTLTPKSWIRAPPRRTNRVSAGEGDVFERELRRFRDCVRNDACRVTDHAWRELHADGLTVLDFEACVLGGCVVERQRDHQTLEWKYVIEGQALDGSWIAVVVKRLVPGRMALLTAYRI